MIEGLKPYAAYKDSGVPWFGEVPESWEVQRVKHLFRYRKVLNDDGREQNVLSLTLRGVVNNDPENPEGMVPKDYRTYQIFDRNDFVFKLIDLENLRTSRVGLVHERGIMSSAYVRLTLSADGDTRFFYHQFFNLYTRGIYNQLGAGVRSTLGPVDLLNINVLAPSVSEEHAIVRFLDHAERRIRRNMRAKQKLIKLLEEQKQAVIHRAVTRGLDLNVRLKSSGVEWLGDVPEHWTIMPLKWAFVSMEYGISESATDVGRFRLLGMGHIKNGVVTVPDSGGVDEVDPQLFLMPNDLLFNRTNSAELVGKVGLFRGASSPVTFASYLVRLRPRDNNDPKFLNYLLNDPVILQTARREAIPSLHQANLNPTRYGRLQIALPPQSEQAAIVAGINGATANLDLTIRNAERELALLHEYHKRLVTDVVTGKVDVREAVAGLPEEVAELEALDELEDLVDDDETAEILDLEAEDAA